MRVAIYCYPSAENIWSPQSMERGIGGSEEAVIQMAAELSARGHEVCVVNARHGASRRYGDVTWCSYDEPPASGADIAVLWHRPGLIDRAGPHAARKFYLWLHDMLPEADILPRLESYTKVMVLSRFHRNHYPTCRKPRFSGPATGSSSASSRLWTPTATPG